MSRRQKIYIIHGWTYNLDKWQPILPLLSQSGLVPVLLQVPGLTAPSKNIWDIDDYVAWLAGELKDEPNPIVIGHSNGGRIALRFDNIHPHKIQKLILIDAAGVPLQGRLRRAKLAALRGLALLGRPLKKIPPLRRLFQRAVGAHDYMQAPDNMRRTMQNMLKANEVIDFAAVTSPTTLIWGAADQQTPVSEGRFMERHIPGARLHIIDGARHAPMYTHPTEVAALITEAVREVII